MEMKKFTKEAGEIMRKHLEVMYLEQVEKFGTGISYKDIVDGVDEKAKKIRDENGTFDVIISTEDVDRTGEIVKQDGWQLANYKNNPIVLFGHDYYSPGIGITLETYKTITAHGTPALAARGVFYDADTNPLAQQVRKMYEFGIKMGVGAGCTTSVGFIPEGFDENDKSIITQSQLLEFSFVPVPANQGVGPAKGRKLTEDEAKELGLDIFGLKAKGLSFTSFKGAIKEAVDEVLSKKGAKPGDSCELADGTPGVLTTDPDDDTALVCVGDTDDKGHDDTTQSGDDYQGDDMKALMENVQAEHGRHDDAVRKSLDNFRTKGAAILAESGDDADKKSAAETSMKKELKSLESALDDEHDMHRSNNVASFRKYAPPGDKKAQGDMDSHIKALKTEHKDYGGICSKSLDEFKEKCLSVEGDGVEDHTDWITAKMVEHQGDHQQKVTKIAKAMAKDFGESDQTEEKMWWMKATVADELAESEERQQKFQKVDRAWDIFDAFLCAYLDDTTPVADFEKLLDEAIGLLKTDASAKGLIKTYLAFNTKAGAKLSAATKSALAEAHGHIVKGLGVIHALSPDIHPDGGDEGGEPEEKKSVLGTSHMDDVQQLILRSDLARSIARPLNEFLAESNKIARDYYVSKGRK